MVIFVLFKAEDTDKVKAEDQGVHKLNLSLNKCFEESKNVFPSL